MSVLHPCRSCGLPMDAGSYCEDCGPGLAGRIMEVADREADAIRALVRALPPRPPLTGTWAEADPLMLLHGGGP